MRVPLRARVALSSASLEELVAGPLHDISLGGLFIKTRARRPVGTQISIRIVVPSESVTLELRGVIVRVVSAEEALSLHMPAGLAVMFTDLDDPTTRTLARLVDAALELRDGER